MASRVQRRRAARTGLLLLAGLGGTSGCADTLHRWRTARDGGIAKAPTAEEVGDDRPWIARLIRPKAVTASDPNGKSTLVLGSDGWKPPEVAANPVAEAELNAAEKLVQEGKLAEAETAFARMAKARKDTSWGEKAQFGLAKVQRERGNLVGAHDSFETLVAKYPGTRYIDEAVKAEYEIAQIWLESTDPNAAPEKAARLRDRFTGRLPLVDARGTALAALEHVRHNDATGPLADKAVLRIADQHYADGNYEEAAIHYDQLVAEHPKSSLLQHAQIASIDSKVKSYLGPEYDGSGLESARDTIKQTMTMFPERAVSHSDNLYKTLDLINDQEAERTYKIGEHYLWTGKVNSAEFYFGEIPARWPKSEWAKRAKVQLAKIATMPRKETLPSRIMTQPGSTDPMTGSGGGGMGGGMGGSAGGMGGMGGPNGGP